MKKIYSFFIVSALVAALAGCGKENDPASPTDTVNSISDTENLSGSEDTSDMFTDRDLRGDYDTDNCVSVTLNGSSAACDEEGVTISDAAVTITTEGTYLLSGTLDDGAVIIDADKSDKIQLVLNGVNINNNTSAAIYVKQADKVFVTTAANTENTLTNGGSYTQDGENNIDAVIFSKEDLTLNGEGALTINAESGHGIVSKDDLVLAGGTCTITAKSHGIVGKDSVRIAGGTFTVTSGKDGVHAENNEDENSGFLYIADGTFQITSDGKGICGAVYVTIENGNFTIDTADDAVHANGDVAISGGKFAIAAGDDGIHADNAAAVSGGTITISQSYEGIEGKTIDITGGEIDITASDDGLNAAGGNDGSGFGGRGGDRFAGTDGVYLNITGGKLHVNASGDGIDSNGDLTVSGGEIYVSGPTDNGNGTLDYDGNATITGGIVIAAGSAGMAQNFGSSSTQGSMLVNISGNAGDTIILSDSNGKQLASWSADKAFDSVVISTPDVAQGSTYMVSVGDSTTAVTMDRLIYGTADGMSGENPKGGPGNSGGGAPPDGMGGRP